MSQTNPVRTSSWGQSTKAVLAGLVFLPILALTFVEWFIDPFPNSLWILRILNTDYLVHVRADLTVDGEPLVMERTIRCFDPVDYEFLNRWIGRRNYVPTGQAGDTITATTRGGRLFAINAADACFNMISKQNMVHGHYTFELYPNAKKLSRDELSVPVVYEIMGWPIPKRIDAYVSRRLLREGYLGVKLDELTLEVSGRFWMLKDWSAYDAFGLVKWFRRPDIDGTSYYDSSFLVKIPESEWIKLLEKIYESTHRSPQLYKKIEAQFLEYSSETESSMIEDKDWRIWAAPNFFNTYLDGLGLISKNASEKLMPFPQPISRLTAIWMSDATIPCAPVESDFPKVICNSNAMGTLSYYPREKMTYPFHRQYVLGSFTMETPQPNGLRTFLDAGNDRALYQLHHQGREFIGR